MSYKDFQQICENGHQITDSMYSHPEDNKNFCPQCGAKTISKCPSCHARIPGHEYHEGVFFPYQAEVPEHCGECGTAFPWVGKKPNNQPTALDTLALILEILPRFHLMAAALRTRRKDRTPLLINDEYDVQYILYGILKLIFQDVRVEEGTESFAGKASRMDFLLSDEQIVIETKMTREDLRDREIGSELIEDIVRYSKHGKCKTLICLVYDPDHKIKNPPGLEKDLSKISTEIQVRILIVPKGL